jgi:hypothetical protein
VQLQLRLLAHHKPNHHSPPENRLLSASAIPPSMLQLCPDPLTPQLPVLKEIRKTQESTNYFLKK